MKPSSPALLLLLTLWVTGMSSAAAGATTTASASADAIQAVIDEYENAVRANTLKLIAAPTEAEKDRYRASVPSVAPYAERVLGLIRKSPAQPQTARGVSWLVTQAAGLPEGQAALEMLGKTHAGFAGIAPAVKALEYHPQPVAEPILLAVREKNPNATERAAATYALGVQQFRIYENPAQSANQECCGGGGELEKTAEAAREKAMGYFQEVIASYPDAAIQGFPLADQASKMMFEMANLAVGVKAPEIEGKDIEGQAFKLSDFRGKQVVLIFWGGWCHACHDVLPMVNELALAMKDKPVAVLGINTDIPEEARKALEQYQVKFRNWSDGATSGPITSMFNLRGFPTVYLLDAEGKIVLKNSSIQAVTEKLRTLGN